MEYKLRHVFNISLIKIQSVFLLFVFALFVIVAICNRVNTISNQHSAL